MTEEEARRIAEAYLAAEAAGAGVELAIVETETLERPFGWVFFYNTRRFLETGDEMASAVGNAPFIVDRRSGRVDVAGTSHPIEHYLSLYERFGTCHPRRS